MAVFIVLGVIAGAGGFAPLIAGLRLARKATPTSNLGHAASLLLGLLGSMLILAGSLILCVVFAREQILPFALAEVGALVCTAVGFGVYTFVRK